KIKHRPTDEQLRKLWGYETSPYTLLVRDVLSDMKDPFIFHNVDLKFKQLHIPDMMLVRVGKYEPLPFGKGEDLFEMIGNNIQVPYLVDPNTGVNMFESAEIVKYLKQQYGAA